MSTKNNYLAESSQLLWPQRRPSARPLPATAENRRNMKYILFMIFLLSATGLFAQHLNVGKISYLELNGNEIALNKDSLLKDKIVVELIEEAIFRKAYKSKARNFIVFDSASVEKSNGVFHLPLHNGHKEFVDVVPEIDEERKHYTYVGQIPFLDLYLVKGSYWEHSDFILIDKNTGEKVLSIGDFPNISGDQQFIISLKANVYESETSLELYQIINGELYCKLRTSFRDWMPIFEKDQMFWNGDSQFFIPVIKSQHYFNKIRNVKNDYRYIRLTIK